MTSHIYLYYWPKVKLTAILNLKPEDAKRLHPGGTAAIGKVVDKDFQTKVDGLFVCDASILPVTPGLPPILTIVTLAKRSANVLP
ncbi:MAG TPA: GMC oxidoreductase [Dehalococcoidia bacterium]|nr:GMC oxidoreductase [Dehalococcoidia bacterium]